MAPAARETPVIVSQVAPDPTAGTPDNTFMWTNLVVRSAEFFVGSVLMFVGVAALLKSGMRGR